MPGTVSYLKNEEVVQKLSCGGQEVFFFLGLLRNDTFDDAPA